VYASTRHTNVAKRRCSLLGLADRDIDLLKGVDCDILTQGLIGLTEYSCHQDISSFLEAQL
jgi:hypothetical protein